MFLHLGKDVVVQCKNIIGIFDLESTTISKTTKEFLKLAEEDEFVKNVTTDLPKTFILCEIEGKSVIYITNISSKTLQKRQIKGNIVFN